MITIVYGPQASGKTRNKAALARFFGHTTIIDGLTRAGRRGKFHDDQGGYFRDLPVDALILTTMTREECMSLLDELRSDGTFVSIETAIAKIPGMVAP